MKQAVKEASFRLKQPKENNLVKFLVPHDLFLRVLTTPVLQDTTMLPLNAQQVDVQSTDPDRIQSSVPSDTQDFGQLQSSPVVGVSDVSLPLAVDTNEPQLPTNPQLGIDESMGDDTTLPSQGNRREMFRMIESIRSSSPANTPGKLGFETPVHLRRAHTLQANDIPLTPLLAPTENDEAFINSSPTPATRDPTPAPKSDLLAPLAVPMNDATDLPSSPPELDSRSPSPKKQSTRSRNSRRSNARAKRAAAHNSIGAPSIGLGSVESIPVTRQAADATSAKPLAGNGEHIGENSSPSWRNARLSNGRFRSALSQNTDNNQTPTPQAAPGTPGKQISSPSVPNSRSKSASKRRRRRELSNSAAKGSQQPLEKSQPPPVPPPVESIVDSSSEELETQIASQLEQDLEFAVDFGDGSQHRQAADTTPVPTSRKRKREEDGRSTTTKEKRRSTRLSSKDPVLIEVEDLNATQSQDTSAPAASEDTPLAKPSSTTPRRATRSSQRNDEQAETPRPRTELSKATPQTSKRQESSQSTSKRSRKSTRLDNPSSATSTVVEIPSSENSARSTRSRNNRSSQHASQSQFSQDEMPQPNTSTAKSDLAQAGNYDVEVIPDSISLLDNITHDIPLVSTEEATNSRSTEISPPAEPQATIPEFPMPMDLDATSQLLSSGQPGRAVSVATAGTQTDPLATSEAVTSEAGITQSLQRLLHGMKSATLSPKALREVDDLLFNIRVEAHDASQRHNHPA